MFSKVFLAQTAREQQENTPIRAAYMACHFSASGAGLSNLPDRLPENSILLLDDSMPINGHDPQTVIAQLTALIRKFSVGAVLLDLQGEKTAEAKKMAGAVVRGVPCPVAVTAPYAKQLGCPVFLSPVPVNASLQAHLHPWLKQGVFLEIAPEALQITVTDRGSVTVPVWPENSSALPLEDQRLHCHYKTEVFPEKAVFTLQRTKEDLSELVRDAYRMGVRGVVGLYQELSRL